MKKILITGFEPFLQNLENPSSVILKDLVLKLRLANSNYQIETLVLPVTYQEAFNNLNKFINNQQFDYIIHLGLAQSRNKISIERVAINCIDSDQPDNDGVKFNFKKIIANGPDGIFTNLADDVANLKALTNISEEVEISNSCGTYVCNYLFYQSLYKYRMTSRVAFIHLPSFENMTKQNQIGLLSQIILKALEHNTNP